MSRIDKGRRVSLTYKERGASGGPTLVVDVSGESDLLPHEHRDDIRTVAAEVLGVPLRDLEGVEVEMKRVPHGHPHSHLEDRPKAQEKPAEVPTEPMKGGA